MDASPFRRVSSPTSEAKKSLGKEAEYNLHAAPLQRGLVVGNLKVSCYAGYERNDLPQNFMLNGRVRNIDRVIDQWLSPDHRYFKVESDGATYILRQDMDSLDWELVVFDATHELSH